MKPPKPPKPPEPPPPRLYNGAGLRIDRPPTTEYHYTNNKSGKVQLMSINSFHVFMWCAFGFDVAIGSIL